MEFQYRGMTVTKVPAQIVGEELEKIRASAGGLDPATVVSVASAANHPLHKCFTWDDAKAAHLCRIDEARKLIKNISIVTEARPPMVAYVNISHNNYQRTDFVVNTPSEFERALTVLQRQFTGIMESLQSLSDLSPSAAVAKATTHVGKAKDYIAKVA